MDISPFGSRLSKKEIKDYLVQTFGIRPSDWVKYEDWFRFQYDNNLAVLPEQWPWDEVGLSQGVDLSVVDADKDNAEIIDRMANLSGVHVLDAEVALKAIIEKIHEVMVRDQRFQLNGFGKFYYQVNLPRLRFQPRNRTYYTSKLSVIPSFRMYHAK